MACSCTCKIQLNRLYNIGRVQMAAYFHVESQPVEARASASTPRFHTVEVSVGVARM